MCMLYRCMEYSMFYREFYVSPGTCWEIPTEAVDPGIPRNIQKIIRKILESTGNISENQ